MLFKLGKRAAKRDSRTLKLASYTKALTPAPLSCDMISGTVTDIGMMLNDVLGDCTIATIGHIIQQWTAEAGDQVILGDDVIQKLYELIAGYVPGDLTTDNGAVILDVLNYWHKNPIEGNILSAYVSVNPGVTQQVKNAIFYFGCAYIGVQLPISSQSQDIWDVPFEGAIGNGAIGSLGGHAIPVVAYNNDYVVCITWGQLKKMTWNFFLTYCDECYGLLSPDWIDPVTGKCPVDFDLVQLQTDLALL